jgi:hypothetical protein
MGYKPPSFPGSVAIHKTRTGKRSGLARLLRKPVPVCCDCEWSELRTEALYQKAGTTEWRCGKHFDEKYEANGWKYLAGCMYRPLRPPEHAIPIGEQTLKHRSPPTTNPPDRPTRPKAKRKREEYFV